MARRSFLLQFPPTPANKPRTPTAKSGLLGFIHFLKASNITAMIGFVPFLRMTKWKP
jgi:hypothetical protein